MPKYTRIRLKEREEIYRLKHLGKLNIEIAEIIGKDKELLPNIICWTISYRSP